MPGDQASTVLQPVERPLDSVPSFVAPERAAILQTGPGPFFPVWADEFDTTFLKVLSQPVRIGSLIVEQASGLAMRRALIDQRLDRGHFAVIGSGSICRERSTLTICQEKDAGSVSTMATSHVVTPFFARVNEPSPIASSQSMPRRWSSLLSNRSQAARKIPLHVQSRCRRQQVAGEGYRSGHLPLTGLSNGLPAINTQRTPSRHSREERQGRPPSGPTGGSGNRSAIRNHCVSERKGFGAALDTKTPHPYFLPSIGASLPDCCKVRPSAETRKLISRSVRALASGEDRSLTRLPGFR